MDNDKRICRRCKAEVSWNGVCWIEQGVVFPQYCGEAWQNVSRDLLHLVEGEAAPAPQAATRLAAFKECLHIVQFEQSMGTNIIGAASAIQKEISLMEKLAVSQAEAPRPQVEAEVPIPTLPGVIDSKVIEFMEDLGIDKNLKIAAVFSKNHNQKERVFDVLIKFYRFNGWWEMTEAPRPSAPNTCLFCSQVLSVGPAQLWCMNPLCSAQFQPIRRVAESRPSAEEVEKWLSATRDWDKYGRGYIRKSDNRLERLADTILAFHLGMQERITRP